MNIVVALTIICIVLVMGGVAFLALHNRANAIGLPRWIAGGFLFFGLCFLLIGAVIFSAVGGIIAGAV